MKIKAIIFEWMIDNKISANDICYFVFQGSYNIEKMFSQHLLNKFITFIDAAIDLEHKIEKIRIKLKERKDFDLGKAFHSIY